MGIACRTNTGIPSGYTRPALDCNGIWKWCYCVSICFKKLQTGFDGFDILKNTRFIWSLHPGIVAVMWAMDRAITIGLYIWNRYYPKCAIITIIEHGMITCPIYICSWILMEFKSTWVLKLWLTYFSIAPETSVCLSALFNALKLALKPNGDSRMDILLLLIIKTWRSQNDTVLSPYRRQFTDICQKKYIR